MQPTAVFSSDVFRSALVVSKLLSSLNGHMMHMLEHRGSQAEGITSTASNHAAGRNSTSSSSTAVPNSSTAARSAGDLDSAAASWAPHAGLFCQLLELGLRGSGDVPRLSDVMELFAIIRVTADSKPCIGIGPLFNREAASKPGSSQQLQLISLVCSLMKHMQTPAGRQKQDLELLCNGLCSIMVAMIKFELSLAAESADSDSADSDSEQYQVPSPAVDLAGTLAWLVLLGRCCLLLASLLTSAAAGLPGNAGPALQGQHRAAGSAVQLSPVLINTLWCCEDSILSAQDWLQLSSTSAQLTAAGYSPKNLLQQMQSAAAAVEGPSAADNAERFKTVSQGWVQAAAQALEALGVTLNTLAISHACNNPHCSNLSGPSELQLVGRRSATCAGCLTARYCGNLCQRAHWKQHKPVCKALAEAKQHSSAA